MAEEKKICLDKINVTVAKHTDYPSPEIPETLSFAKEQKLIQESIDSLIKTIPYKHWRNYVKPTDDVSSTFTPGVDHYRARTLKPGQWRPFGADGVLTNPPRVFIEQHNEEVKRRAAAMAEKERDSLPENIVSLKDLADSTWLRKKNEKAKALKRKELEKVRATKRKPDREVIRNKCNLFF
ncbi:uncharacterized protein [Linepithema humile]|uniref:uncharacterized protein n=1 Tax=Linepithema humile TaxID=83485 RepID=UPI00351F6E1F